MLFDNRNHRNWPVYLFSLAARKLTAKSETHLWALAWPLCSLFSLSTFSTLFSLILIFHFYCISFYWMCFSHNPSWILCGIKWIRNDLYGEHPAPNPLSWECLFKIFIQRYEWGSKDGPGPNPRLLAHVKMSFFLSGLSFCICKKGSLWRWNELKHELLNIQHPSPKELHPGTHCRQHPSHTCFSLFSILFFPLASALVCISWSWP